MFLERYASRWPAKAAVVMTESGESTSYAELNQRSTQFAHALRAAGLARGSHIAYLLENSPRCFEVIWGAYRSGLYYTPLNTRLNADEVAYILDDSGAEAFVASSTFASVATEAMRKCRTKIKLAISGGGSFDGFQSYGDVVLAQPGNTFDDESPGSGMMYSSGTTGHPKGVERSLPSAPFDAPDPWLEWLGRLYDWSVETRYLCPAPLYHGAGLWYTTAQHRIGATAFVMEKFDAEEFLAAIEKHRITCAQVVPTMLIRLLRLPADTRQRYDLSSLTHLIHAAAPCPIWAKEQVIDWLGPIVYEYYAATEANGYCWIDTEDWMAHKGSVGRAIVGTPHIVGEDGRELPAGSSGVVYFESRGEPFRYHNDDAKTRESRHPSGWTAVGDMGYLDDDGYLYLTDRKSHMIISGGVNIYPQEVENVLAGHPAVADVAVIGVPNDEFGEEVKAVVQLRSPESADVVLSAELIDYCRDHLAHYKCPRSVDFVAALPRGENGKLYKRELRDPYWEGRSSSLV